MQEVPIPTYLVLPPSPELRMGFMDALEEAEIDYSRDPEGYFIFLRAGQEKAWEQIRLQFQAVVTEEDPPMVIGL